MAAAFSSQHVQWNHLKEEVDENFLDVDTDLVLDPHYEAFLETHCSRPQLRSDVDLAAMADSTQSRMSQVEAWINQELFGDVVEGEMCQPDEGEVYITTLRKDVDEYIEMLDFGHAVVPAIGGEQYYYHVQRDDSLLSPVDSECRGMYYDEPQLWSFS